MVAAKFDTPAELAKVFVELSAEDKAAFFAAIHPLQMALPREQCRDCVADGVRAILANRQAFSYVVALSSTLLTIAELLSGTAGANVAEAIRQVMGGPDQC